MPGIAASLEGLAAIGQADGRYQFAARLFAAADGLRQATGCPAPPAQARAYEQDLAVLRGALGEQTLETIWRTRRGESLGDVVSYALDYPGSR
jgi:hypothetical protein